MVEKSFRLKAKEGLHLRPAGLFVKEAKKFDCKTTVIYKDKKIDAASPIMLVAACMKYDDKYTIRCEGKQEIECLEALTNLNLE